MKNGESCGKVGKMGKICEKLEIGSRQGKERQQGTPSRNRKPETGNSGFWIRTRNLVFDSGLDLVQNGLRRSCLKFFFSTHVLDGLELFQCFVEVFRVFRVFLSMFV